MHFLFVKYSIEKSTERASCKYILNSISTKQTKKKRFKKLLLKVFNVNLKTKRKLYSKQKNVEDKKGGENEREKIIIKINKSK